MLSRIRTVLADPRMSGHLGSKLARIAAWEWIRLTHRTDITVHNGPRTLVANYDDGVARLLYYFGGFEGVFQHLITASLSNGDRFVDVGANIGLFTQVAGDATAPDGSVVAFEPSPGAVERLRRNATAPHIRVENMAVGDTDQPVHFHLARDSAQGHITTNGAGKTITVPCCRLDDYFDGQSIDYLKIDVEGFELGVLKGARGLITETRIGIFQIEVNDDQHAIFTLLDQAGYDIHVCRHKTMNLCRDTDAFQRMMGDRTWNVIACLPEHSARLSEAMHAYYDRGGL